MANSHTSARAQKWRDTHVRPLAGEQVLITEAFIPAGGNPTNIGAAVTTLVNPLAGAAVGVRASHNQADKAILESQIAEGSCADRFPKTAIYLSATPTRLVVTDINHLTGKTSMLITDYDLDDVESLKLTKGSFRYRNSELRFTDGSAVVLKSPRGGGYSPQHAVPVFASIIERHSRNKGRA